MIMARVLITHKVILKLHNRFAILYSPASPFKKGNSYTIKFCLIKCGSLFRAGHGGHGVDLV